MLREDQNQNECLDVEEMRNLSQKRRIWYNDTRVEKRLVRANAYRDKIPAKAASGDVAWCVHSIALCAP
jgi:hypothetical protein